MIGLILAGITTLVIAFGLKKVHPLVGGFISALAYFLVSMCTVSSLSSGLRGAAGGDETVALLSAIITEGLISAVIAAIAAAVIWGIRKLR